jgi:hypothetical protein
MHKKFNTFLLPPELLAALLVSVRATCLTGEGGGAGAPVVSSVQIYY